MAADFASRLAILHRLHQLRVERDGFAVVLGFMQRSVPALQRRMRLIETRLLRQFFAEGAPFADAMAVQQFASDVARFGAGAQLIEAALLAGQRADAGNHN